MKKLFLFTLLLFVSVSCGDFEDVRLEEEDVVNIDALYNTTNKIIIEVAYEPGAEPFIGTNSNGLNYWDIPKKNLEALFKGRKLQPLLQVPKTLEEMVKLPPQNKSKWSGQDVYDLSKKFRGRTIDPKRCISGLSFSMVIQLRPITSLVFL
jgi:hypothetical protein